MITIPRRAGLAIVGLVLLPAFAFACLWDYDTIRMERSRFPSVLELITGKFLRHSPEYYQWRITDREKRLQNDPNDLALLDDLAVAYDKLGQHDKAIAIARKQDAIQPSRYETHSNLGTFLFHAGKLEESVRVIDAALAINPDAHFGREKYQKLLTEYVLKRRASGQMLLPLADVTLSDLPDISSENHPKIRNSFTQHLFPELKGNDSTQIKVNREAIQAISGMLRFAKYDSPILLEALGCVLRLDPWIDQKDAKQLASRCYLQASYQVPDGPQRQNYRAMAGEALYLQVRPGTQDQIRLNEVEELFQKEITEANQWYAELRSRELEWITNGQNPDVEFARLYAADPELSGMDVKDPMSFEKKINWGIKTILTLVSVVVTAGVALIGYVIRRLIRTPVATRPKEIRAHPIKKPE